MSFSKECQEYHLTPRGWIEGSFKDDMGGSEDASIPGDRVLTFLCYTEIPSAFSKPFYYDQVAWKSDDKGAIRQMKREFGRRPSWHGYKSVEYKGRRM